jgi:hypothetical protein
MAVTPNTILSSDTIPAIFSEYISRYQGEFDRFNEVVGFFAPEVVTAGTTLYKYVVNGSLVDAAIDPGTIAYEKTRDTDVVTGKTYYTKSGDTYTEVQSPAKADLKNYYVAYAQLGSSSGRKYVEGDEIALSHFDLTEVPLRKVNFIPYRFRVTAQAIQQGGLKNAVTRFVDQAYKQLRSDTVADIFDWLNLFDGATVADPASGTTWGLQQMLAHTEDTLLNTLETNRENDTDIVHFLNRSDVYDYLANATITTQDLFGMTYLENFLGVNKVFLTNRVTAGTCVATPVANLKAYGIDFATLNAAEFDYQTDGSNLIGFAYDKAMDHAAIEVYPVRTLTIAPEVEQFVVRGSMEHVA